MIEDWIDKRNNYLPVSSRASCLCFWAETLADYDPMSVYTTFVVSYVTVLQKCKTLGGAQMIL